MTVQIANYSISDRSKVQGDGTVTLFNRADAVSSGVFKVVVKAAFDPATDDYPVGSVEISTDLSDSIKGQIVSTTIEQLNTHGKHTPTSIITGRCKVHLSSGGKGPRGCRFWLLIADNGKSQKKTPDIVSFIVYDRNGDRVSYGTGPLDGDIAIDPTGI